MVLTYFVQAVSGGPIKIGRSKNLRTRVRELNCASPHALMVVATVAGDREAELHSRFSKDRLRGEWFADSTQLRHWMVRNASFEPGMRQAFLLQQRTVIPPLNKEAASREAFRYDEVFDVGESVDDDVWEEIRELGPYLPDDPHLPGDDCECPWCMWDRGVSLVADTDIVDRVGILIEEQLVCLIVRPLNTRHKVRKLAVLADAAWLFDCAEWHLCIRCSGRCVSLLSLSLSLEQPEADSIDEALRRTVDSVATG